MTRDKSVPLRVGFEVIDRFAERNAGLFSKQFGDRRAEFRVAVDAGPDRSAAAGELVNLRGRVFGALSRKFELAREPAEFLTEGQRGSVGEVRAAILMTLFPGAVLAFRIPAHRSSAGTSRFRISVATATWIAVGNISFVDYHSSRVVRMDLLLLIEAVVTGNPSAVRDNFVRIHIRRGAGAGLVHVDREFGAELPSATS